MPVPELNAQGIDISNTLLKIDQMKKGAGQEEHYNLQNALLKRRMTPEAVANENALLQLKQNKEDADLRRENMEDTTKAIAWIKDTPDPDARYANFKAVATKEFAESEGQRVRKGVHPDFLPDTDLFYVKSYDEKLGKEVTRWDADAFDRFANGGLLSMKMALHPEEGKTWDVVRKNPEFGIKNETGALVSPEATKYEKIHLMIKDGKPTALGASVIDSPLAEDKQAFKEGAIRHYDKGGKTVYEEFDGTAWKVKSESPKWKPGGEGEKPEYKEGQARRRMAANRSAKAKLQSGSQFDALLRAEFPEYAESMGSEDPQVIGAAIKDLDDEYAYLSKFVPKGTANPKPAPVVAPSAAGAPGQKNFGGLWGVTAKTNRPSPVF